MDLEELKKMKETAEGAARDVQNTIQTNATDFEKSWSEATGDAANLSNAEPYVYYPHYKHPGKKWRVKVGATPQWFKARSGVRTKALSGAARVAKYRPKKFN